jgi:hypothetical protein
MSTNPIPLPAIGSRCWRGLMSPETGATVLNLAAETSDRDPMVELVYDEGGSGARAAMPSVIDQIPSSRRALAPVCKLGI